MTARENEELRFAVREVIATRFPGAYTAEMIGRRVTQSAMLDFAVTTEAVTAALKFLAGLAPAQVEMAPSGMGATDFWVATSAGVRAWERGER